MGILFGKPPKDHVKVLTIKETQSLPVIRLRRKYVTGGASVAATRSTSYQTTLPNLVSSDDESVGAMIAVPPPSSLPPAIRAINMGTRDVTMRTRDVTMRTQQHALLLSPCPTVVAELTSSTDEYSSCTQDRDQHIQRQNTILMKEILGRRIEKSRDGTNSSRKPLSSRGSYRKTCLKSRKRYRKNSYLTESSLSKSDAWESEDSEDRSGDETQSDVRALINDRPAFRNMTGCRMSRKSTLNSALRFNSSSDEGLVDYSLKRQLNKNDRRTRRDGISKGQLLTSVAGVITERVKSVRVSSAWDGAGRKTSKFQPFESDDDSYDASSELSSSEPDDELDYSTRRKTNPFLSGMRTNNYYRRQKINEFQPSKLPMKPDLVNILPNYAKSSYTANSYKQHTFNRTGCSKITISQKDRKFELQRVRNEGARRSRRKQNDGFDELDSAVDMLNMIL